MFSIRFLYGRIRRKINLMELPYWDLNKQISCSCQGDVALRITSDNAKFSTFD